MNKILIYHSFILIWKSNHTRGRENLKPATTAAYSCFFCMFLIAPRSLLILQPCLFSGTTVLIQASFNYLWSLPNMLNHVKYGCHNMCLQCLVYFPEVLRDPDEAYFPPYPTSLSLPSPSATIPRVVVTIAYLGKCLQFASLGSRSFTSSVDDQPCWCACVWAGFLELGEQGWLIRQQLSQNGTSFNPEPCGNSSDFWYVVIFA